MSEEKYEFLKDFDQRHVTIGFGSYGQVKLARNVSTGQLVAIKFIYNRNAQKEIQMLNKLDHPNIIRLLNHNYDSVKNTTYMVFEYINGGNLFERLRAQHMKKQQIRKIYQEVCLAVAAMHQEGIMHRDIKPENILLTKAGDAKLCDLGFATLISERKTLCGTYEYMAPEMIQHLPYGPAIDVWALGILLFEMIEGVAPFRGTSPEQVIKQMHTSIPFSTKFTEQEIYLIKSILRVDPSKRPTVKEILKHSIFCSETVRNFTSPHKSATLDQFPKNQEQLKKKLTNGPLEPKQSPLQKMLSGKKKQLADLLDVDQKSQNAGTEPCTPKCVTDVYFHKNFVDQSINNRKFIQKKSIEGPMGRQNLTVKNKIKLQDQLRN